MVICYDDSDKSNIELSVDLERNWEYNLSLELVLPKDKTISLAALAALFLWQLTYDNWSDYQEESSIYRALNPRKSSNKYEVALECLENSIYKRQTSKLFLPKLKKDRLMRFTILPAGASNKMFNKFLNGDDRMNRSKRKRKYRQEKRKEFLKRIGNRQAIVDKFTMTGSSFAKGICDFLLHIKEGEKKVRFRSPNTKNSLDYVYTSMTDYCALPTENYSEAIVYVTFKDGHVASSQEIDSFKKRMEKLMPCDVSMGRLKAMCMKRRLHY